MAGGFFAQLWLTLDTLNEEYKSLLKKFDGGDEYLCFTEKKVNSIHIIEIQN